MPVCLRHNQPLLPNGLPGSYTCSSCATHTQLWLSVLFAPVMLPIPERRSQP